MGNIYNNANKVLNLYKGLPIGAITWRHIGPSSIATRRRVTRGWADGMSTVSSGMDPPVLGQQVRPMIVSGKACWSPEQGCHQIAKCVSSTRGEPSYAASAGAIFAE